MRRLILFSVFSLLCVSRIASLFEDQIGKFDWRRQLVGKLRFGRISGDATALAHKRFFAATEENVLALVSTETGELDWRQLLGSDGKIDDMLLRVDDVSVAFGGQSKIVYNFDSLKGTLNWEFSINKEKCLKDVKLLDTGTDSILIYFCNRLILIDNSGNSIWKLTLPKVETILYAKFVLSGEKFPEILVVDKSEPNVHSILYRVNANSGIISNEIILQENIFDRFAYIGQKMFAINSLRGDISTVDPVDGKVTPVLNIGNSVLQITQLNSESIAFIDSSYTCHIYKANENGLLSKVAAKSFENIIDVKSASYESKYFLVIAHQNSQNETFVTWIDAYSGDEVKSASYQIVTEELSNTEEIFPVVFSRSGATHVFRTIVLRADYSLSAFQSSPDPLWVREEALSQILSVEMVDLPLSEAQASVESEFSTLNQNVVSMFVKRLTTQAIQIQRGFMRLVNESLYYASAFASGSTPSEWMSIAKKVSSPLSFKDTPFERDYFNLHKVIVVATKVGKVFGLDNRSGKMLWQFYHPEIVPFNGPEGEIFSLYVQRTTAHYPYPAQCILIGRHRETNSGYYILFDPVSGKVKKTVDIKRTIKQAVLLPVATDDELFAVAFVVDSNEAIVYPSTIKNVLAKWLLTKPIFLFNVEMTNGTAVGRRLNKLISVDSASNSLIYDTQDIWNAIFPLGKGGKIIAIKMKRLYEHVHSQGRVLGDRSVLYKYSNPNLVALVIERVDESNKKSYHIYLFDAVTGAVIFSLAHHRVDRPFHMAHCENWLIYTLYNEKSRRMEFTVLELYEGKVQTDPDKFSSFAVRPPPIVMRQSYIFPQGVSALAVTNTEKGIASRHLIVALPFGGILELHKAFLDPRRVLMPTPEEREEGLIPYIPDLPIATEHLINYNQSIFNVRAIFSSSAGLESTSLVFVYGLDLFYTRVHPSATFDILKDDFDHYFISLMLLGLFLASVLTKRLAKIRDLKLAWK